MNASRIILSQMKSTSSPLSSSSVSFSGAGFLGCYHLGVAHCLIQNKILPSPDELPNNNDDSSSSKMLLGCSAGSIVAAGISSGINPESDGMNIIYEVLNRTKQNTNMILDALTPGFSLIDQIESLLLESMKKNALHGNDEEYFLKRTNNGKLLRIYVTHPTIFFDNTLKKNDHDNDYYHPPALHYIDEYRNIDDVVAACMLSSYIPGGTGPFLSYTSKLNPTVDRSNKRLRSLIQYNPTCFKDSFTNKPVEVDTSNDSFYRDGTFYWDGGLCQMWPIIDHNTLIVSPLHGNYSPNLYISPQSNDDKDDDNNTLLPKYVNWQGYKVNLHSKNIDIFRRMIISPDEEILQQKFYDGYDDTKNFLKRSNLLR